MNRTDIEAALRSAGLPVLPEVTGGADWSVDYAYRLKTRDMVVSGRTALFLTVADGTCYLVWRREDREEGCYRFQLVCECDSLRDCLMRPVAIMAPRVDGPWND